MPAAFQYWFLCLYKAQGKVIDQADVLDTLFLKLFQWIDTTLQSDISGNSWNIMLESEHWNSPGVKVNGNSSPYFGFTPRKSDEVELILNQVLAYLRKGASKIPKPNTSEIYIWLNFEASDANLPILYNWVIKG